MSSEAQHHKHERGYTNYDDRDGVVDFEQHVGGLRRVLLAAC